MVMLGCTLCCTLRRFKSQPLSVESASWFIQQVCRKIMGGHVRLVRLELSYYTSEISILEKIFPVSALDVLVAWICLQDFIQHLNYDRELTISLKLLDSLIECWTVLCRFVSVPMHRRRTRLLNVRFPICLSKRCKRRDIDLWIQQFLSMYLDRVPINRIFCAEMIVNQHARLVALVHDLQQSNNPMASKALERSINRFARLVDDLIVAEAKKM